MMAASPQPARVRLCALLTCFNRRNKTLTCLSALQVSAGHASVELAAVLVDDGSTDGTAAAVRERFAWVQVVETEGDLYWCRGMQRAFERALAQGHDHYLWLNDDTLPDADALRRLLACHEALVRQERRPVIVVGSTRDGHTGMLTYGGERRVSAWRPVKFALVRPQAVAQPVDTFDGNIILVSAAAAAVVGNIDPAFEHAMGDVDYGLRAGRLGVACWLAPGTHGLCSANLVAGTHVDSTLAWGRRWKLMLSRKGLPLRSWWHFTRRHGGPLWPAMFLWPYLRMVAIGIGMAREVSRPTASN